MAFERIFIKPTRADLLDGPAHRSERRILISLGASLSDAGKDPVDRIMAVSVGCLAAFCMARNAVYMPLFLDLLVLGDWH